jgi:hypothetical protein
MWTPFQSTTYPAALSCTPGLDDTYFGLDLPEGSVPGWLTWLEELGIGLPLLSDVTAPNATRCV